MLMFTVKVSKFLICQDLDIYSEVLHIEGELKVQIHIRWLQMERTASKSRVYCKCIE